MRQAQSAALAELALAQAEHDQVERKLALDADQARRHLDATARQPSQAQERLALTPTRPTGEKALPPARLTPLPPCCARARCTGRPRHWWASAQQAAPGGPPIPHVPNSWESFRNRNKPGETFFAGQLPCLRLWRGPPRPMAAGWGTHRSGANSRRRRCAHEPREGPSAPRPRPMPSNCGQHWRSTGWRQHI